MLRRSQIAAPGSPMALAAPLPALSFVPLVLQTLFAAPPIRQAFSHLAMADDRAADLTDYWKGKSPVGQGHTSRKHMESLDPFKRDSVDGKKSGKLFRLQSLMGVCEWMRNLLTPHCSTRSLSTPTNALCVHEQQQSRGLHCGGPDTCHPGPRVEYKQFGRSVG